MNGIVIVNKPAGISSFKAVNEIKKISGSMKAGHAGTLDLEAEGVLIVLLNEARKLFELFMAEKKTYEATVRLGWRSTTWDSGGEIEKVEDVKLTKRKIENTLRHFKGKYIHKVPEFSAKKHRGKTFYSIKRSGKTPPERIQESNIYEIQLKESRRPDIKISVACSSGTYIRTLAVDIASKLGTDAYLKKLIRIKINDFGLERAVSPDEPDWKKGFVDINKVMLKFPYMVITQKAAEKIPYGICFGRDDIIKVNGKIENDKFGVYTPDYKFIALAQVTENNYKLRRVIGIGNN